MSNILRQMEIERYLTIKEAMNNWGKYSPTERLSYVQKSFDQLNSYYCEKYNLHTTDTKFGFTTGYFAAGGYSASINSVIMPVAVCAYQYNPMLFDRILRHELKHMQQYIMHTKVGEKRNYSGKTQSINEHESSKNEKDADKAAFLGMVRMQLTAALKSDNKVEPCKELLTTTKQFIWDRFSHLTATVAYKANEIKQNILKKETTGENLNQEVFQTGGRTDNNVQRTLFGKNGVQVYSLGQLERVISSNPEAFKNIENYKVEGKECLAKYRMLNEQEHEFSAFFGAYREDHSRVCFTPLKNLNQNGGRYTFTFQDARYNIEGNLINREDINHQYSCYTPSEVSLAREQMENNENLQNTTPNLTDFENSK